MALVLSNRVQETATANTTVSFTLLGAVSGFQTFGVIGNTNTTYYSATDGDGNWEVGLGTYSTSGATLTRTTVYESSNSGSAVTFSGTVTVFVTYPSGRSVNLDASGNVSALGTVSSGAWQGSTVGVAYGGTGVTASSGANSVVLRDADQNVSVNSVTQSISIVTAAAGTTSLTTASPHFQILVGTGVQTFALPDATSLPTGSSWIFDNDSTGDLTVTNNAGATVDVVAPGGYATVFLEANGTVGGTWGRFGMIPNEVNWGTNNLNLGGSTLVSGGSWQGSAVAPAYGGTGLTTFAGANNALYSTGSSTLTAGTLPVLAGGTGTTTPSIIAGSNITVTGTWPNQTIDASGGGGAQVGEIYIGTNAPSTGTWLETGEYYSKATYPDLASAVGDVEDYKSIQVPQSNLVPATSPKGSGTYRIYCTATNGTTTVIVGSGGFKYTTDGLNWTPVLYGSNTISFEGIRYLNGNFVAFGTSGTVVYSTDGISWKSSNIPGGNAIQDTAFGSGVYVAITSSSVQSGAIWYSSDLINWTQPAQILLVNFSRIAYGNGVFVACGVSGVTYSSPDGINWTLRTAGSATVNDVVFINNEFVQVGAGGSYYRSADGASWSSVATGAVEHQSVIYENGVYVLFGTGCAIRTSTDGTTYTVRLSGGYTSNGANILLRAVVWNGTNFIGVTNMAGIWFAGSSNGSTWDRYVDSFGVSFSDAAVIAGNTIGIGNATIRLAGGARYIAMCFDWSYQANIYNSASLPAPQMIAYDSGLNRYVAASSNGITYYSSDADTWTAASLPVGNINFLGASSAVCENGRFFILSLSQTSPNFYTSADGIIWNSIFLGVSSVMTSVAYGAGVWVAVGQNRIFSSPDGLTWTARVTSGTFTSVIFANGLFVAVGLSGVGQTSPDGITWTSRSLSVAGSTMWKVVYDNSLFVATGANGYVTRSADGVTWSAISFTSFNGYSIAYSASLGLWCIVGTSGGIATSPDAATWTIRSNNGETAVTYYNVFWQSGKFYIGSSAGYRSSTNGIVWLRESSARRGVNTYYTGYAGGKFVMVDSSNIQSSEDGVTWNIANNINTEKAISATPTRFYKLGSYYYTCSLSQACISSDGITWQRMRFPFYGSRKMAYSGSVWLMVVPSSDNYTPTTVYRSTDGVNWSKAASFGQRIFFSGTQPGVAGLVYASGRFVLVFDSQSSLYGNLSPIYTSTDGLSWSPTSMPLTPAPRTVASDGTNIVLASTNFFQLFKSSDGGLNWELLALSAGEVTYTNGVWVFAHPNMANVSFVSTDLVTFKGLAIPQNAVTAYSKNGYLHLYANTAKFLAKNDNPAFVTQSMSGSALSGYTTIGGAEYADPVERGDTLLAPCSPLENRYPWLVAEIPAFSYNTTTTFWVPPYGSGGGQKAWIYAGS